MHNATLSLGDTEVEVESVAYRLRSNWKRPDQLLTARLVGTGVDKIEQAIGKASKQFVATLTLPDGAGWWIGRASRFYSRRLAGNRLTLKACVHGLTTLDDKALWGLFMTEPYTTPLLREWIPWIREELQRRDLIEEAQCYHCDVGILNLEPFELDAVVQTGLRNGHLRIGKAKQYRPQPTTRKNWWKFWE